MTRALRKGGRIAHRRKMLTERLSRVTVTRLDDKFRHDVIGEAMEENFRVSGRRIGRQLKETRFVDKDLASDVRILSAGG